MIDQNTELKTVEELTNEFSQIKAEYLTLKNSLKQEEEKLKEANKESYEKLGTLKILYEETEAWLRSAIESTVVNYPDAVLPEGTGTQSKTVVNYDPAKALEWAKQKGMFLELNQKAFESFCLNNPIDIPDFAKVHTYQQATLSSKL